MKWSDPTAILAIVGVAITAVYTLLTALIWNATHKNTQATLQILEAQHRPYLGIVGVELRNDNLMESGISASIKNVGSVPSRRIEVDLEIRLPDGGTRTITHGDRPQFVLFPGNAVHPSIDLTDGEMQYINSDSGLEVAVTVRYQGMSDKQYTTYSSYGYGVLRGFNLTGGTFE